MRVQRGAKLAVLAAVAAMAALLAVPAHAQLPAPVAGETFNAEPTEGTVAAKCKGDEGFAELDEPTQLDVGCVVDATEGTVVITSARGEDGTQTAEFWDGRFKVVQEAGSTATVMKLTGPLGEDDEREVWAEGSGDFTTEGDRGAASIRSTVWLVEDLANGSTRVTVQEGKVNFQDFVKGIAVVVNAGESYTAGQPQSSAPVGVSSVVAGYGGQGGEVVAQAQGGSTAGTADGAGGELPFTGLDLTILIGAGLLLVAVGVAMARSVPRNET